MEELMICTCSSLLSYASAHADRVSHPSPPDYSGRLHGPSHMALYFNFLVLLASLEYSFAL